MRKGVAPMYEVLGNEIVDEVCAKISREEILELHVLAGEIRDMNSNERVPFELSFKERRKLEKSLRKVEDGIFAFLLALHLRREDKGALMISVESVDPSGYTVPTCTADVSHDQVVLASEDGIIRFPLRMLSPEWGFRALKAASPNIVKHTKARGNKKSPLRLLHDVANQLPNGVTIPMLIAAKREVLGQSRRH